jgi:hypothetical protein
LPCLIPFALIIRQRPIHGRIDGGLNGETDKGIDRGINGGIEEERRDG